LTRRRGVARRRLSGACLVPAACALAGCSLISEDVGQPLRVAEDQLAQARDYASVLRLFGPPHQLSTSPSGMVFLYEEIDVNERQLGINLSIKKATLFKAVMARGMADRRLLLVSFDEAGRTQALRYQERDDAAASGAALQFIFAVAGVVDDDDLSRPPSTHEWGFDLLEADLPAALNRPHRLHDGEHGLQQKATPLGVGQHTLELQSR
jgi:hypothetical protein